MWSPVVTVALLLAIAVFGVVACLYRDRRLSVCLVLRTLAITALAIIAAGPQRVVAIERAPESPRVVVMIDASASMRSGGVDQRALFDRVRSAWWTAAGWEAFRSAADVLVVDHAGRVLDVATPEFSDDTREASPLVRTTEALLAESPAPSHLVLLTDGADTDGNAFASITTDRTRVHVLSLDTVTGAPDARVTLVPDSSLTYTGQPLDLRARVSHVGLAGRRATIGLWDGDDLLEQRIVRLPESAAIEEVFRVTPVLADDVATGTLAYRASLEPIAGELTPANNDATALALVSAEPVRVLVLEGQPHWDTRFFVRAMRADEQVEVTSVSTLENRFRTGNRPARVRIARTGVGGDGDDLAIALPETLEDLAYYDVVVLGRGVEQFYPGRDAEVLRSFVEEMGGSLVFLRGDPVGSDEPEARRAGRVLSVLREGAPQRTLEGGALRRVGAGFTLTADDDAGYRNALRPPSERSDAEAYARAWSSAVRTLATTADLPPGADIALQARPSRVTPGGSVEVSVRARGRAIMLPDAVVLETPSGSTREVSLVSDAANDLRVSALVTGDEEGVYTLRSEEGLEARFVVVEDRAEYLLMSPRAGALRAFAERTGGLVLPIDEGPGGLVEWLERASRGGLVEGVAEPAWDRWWFALLIAVALLGEWVLRRKGVA